MVQKASLIITLFVNNLNVTNKLLLCLSKYYFSTSNIKVPECNLINKLIKD